MTEVVKMSINTLSENIKSSGNGGLQRRVSNGNENGYY